MYFLVVASPPKPLDVATSNFKGIGHMMWMMLGNILSNNVFSCKYISSLTVGHVNFKRWRTTFSGPTFFDKNAGIEHSL